MKRKGSRRPRSVSVARKGAAALRSGRNIASVALAGAWPALSVKVAEPPATLANGGGGGVLSSTGRIRPSPFRAPVAFPAIPEAVRLGDRPLFQCEMLALTAPSFAPESSGGASVRVATAARAPLRNQPLTPTRGVGSSVEPSGHRRPTHPVHPSRPLRAFRCAFSMPACTLREMFSQ